MSPELYLDTARLGRMCSVACRAEQDFVKLVSRLGSSLYSERFLSHGHSSLPKPTRHRFTGLRSWQGISGLKDHVRAVLGQPIECNTYCFGQSNSLIRFGTEALCRRTTSILTTDLEWPPYLEVLREAAQTHGVAVHVLPLQDAILANGLEAVDVENAVVDEFQRLGCDGAFLSHVNYLGIAVPIESIAHRLRCCGGRYLAVDGAQSLGQIPVSLRDIGCDLYLAGTQKWLGAYHPLRLAIGANPRSTDWIASLATIMRRNRFHQDPLHVFTHALEASQFTSFGETVEVLPLITASAVLQEHVQLPELAIRRFRARVLNATRVRRWLKETGHQLAADRISLQSPTVLVRTPVSSDCEAYQLRAQLLRRGIVASVFSTGFIRLAMPSFDLPWRNIAQIENAIDRTHSIRSRVTREPPIVRRQLTFSWYERAMALAEL